jgi:hypothetical protein
VGERETKGFVVAFASAFDAEKFEGIGRKMEKMMMLEREKSGLGNSPPSI